MNTGPDTPTSTTGTVSSRKRVLSSITDANIQSPCNLRTSRSKPTPAARSPPAAAPSPPEGATEHKRCSTESSTRQPIESFAKLCECRDGKVESLYKGQWYQVVVTSVGEAGASLVYPVSKDTEFLEPCDFVVGSWLVSAVEPKGKRKKPSQVPANKDVVADLAGAAAEEIGRRHSGCSSCAVVGPDGSPISELPAGGPVPRLESDASGRYGTDRALAFATTLANACGPGYRAVVFLKMPAYAALSEAMLAARCLRHSGGDLHVCWEPLSYCAFAPK